MTYKKGIILGIVILILVCITILLCINKDDNITNIDTIDLEENINWDNYENTSITLDSTTNIDESGIYTLTGEIEDGLITIDTKGYVKLILNGVSITNSSGPCILINNAKLVVIETYEDSINTLVDGSNYTTDDDDINATIYSKDNLVLTGTGTLNITSNYKDAIVSKDDLEITGGTYIINSKDDGIRGTDSITITNGMFTINTQSDGIKSTKGYVNIEDGTFNIKTTNTSSESSSKAIKALTMINIKGGTFDISSTDDGIHSNDTIYITNGVFNISSTDDGIHSDNILKIEDGTIDISNSYEGLEANEIIINGGSISITSTDDGINAASDTNDNPSLTINDGEVLINAAGDGIDSNGSVYLNGGVIYVNGPTNDGNGAIDYNTEFISNGGTILALGSRGMAQGISSTSSQYGVLINLNTTYNANSNITILNDNGDILVEYTSLKSFSSIAFSSTSLNTSDTFTLKINDDNIKSFTLSSISTTIGSANNNMNMRPGRRR